MSSESDKALLVAFVKWFAAKLDREGRTRWPVIRDADAFLASREPAPPATEQSNRIFRPAPYPQCAPPATEQRYWRVKTLLHEDGRLRYAALSCDANGEDGRWQFHPELRMAQWKTDPRQAEADGCASGLPEWPGRKA